MASSHPLPREICKWLQSLDLSFNVKNPKRDFSNGYLAAEIMSRYFPKDVNILCYENATRLAAKVDNWEQLIKIINKKVASQQMLAGITKQDIDPVIHCADDYAIMFIFKLYSALTKNKLKPFMPQLKEGPLPAFMRDTASRRLKDNEIDRIQDNMEKAYRAIDTLGMFHDERRVLKQNESYELLQQERQRKNGASADALRGMNREEFSESTQVNEVVVNALSTGDATRVPGGRQGGRGNSQAGGGAAAAPGAQNKLLKAVCQPRSSTGALAGLQQPALFVKPAADIMRPLVSSVLQEYEELAWLCESKKDLLVSFMEQCRQGVPEEIAVRVFETLAHRAQLLVDTLTKSPPEFWKVWSTFSPALCDNPEPSLVFDSAVFLFKRIGDLIREADPQLTQQLITEVGLPALGRELARSPEKREALCEIIYSYTQEDTLNHLLVLRALKQVVHELPVYIGCLSCLISVDAQLGLLDEHLLDLYIYYALIATQSPRPKIRVAGISILSTITACSAQQESILGLIPVFTSLAADDWWEVQAQLLVLASHLLSKLAIASHQQGPGVDDHNSEDEGYPSDAVTTPLSGAQREVGGSEAAEDPVESLLNVVGRIFVVSASKNVLQVGLSALVHLLQDFSNLLPNYVAVLLDQPAALRQRLLRPAEIEAGGRAARQQYVTGNASRVYEEKCICSLWPHLDIAKTFVMQLNTMAERFEIEHMEVFLASLPDRFEESEASEWLDVFDRVKQYVLVALVDPKLHLMSTQILKRFWCCKEECISQPSLEKSKKTLIEALTLLYKSDNLAKVEETSVVHFLRDLYVKGGILQIEIGSVLEGYQETNPTEYENSKLDMVFS